MIGGPQSNSWSPTIWARHFGRAQYWTLGIADQHITIMAPHGLTTLHVSDQDKLVFETGAVWIRMTAPAVGIAAPLLGLSKRAASEFKASAAEQLAEYEAMLALEPALRAASDWWSGFLSETSRLWSARRWLTEEFIVDWESRHRRLNEDHPLSVNQRRDVSGRATAVEKEAIDAAGRSDSVRAKAVTQNSALVDVELRDQRDFFDRIEKSPLTEEQSRAVICFDNRVQLVAAAGSGKTSTMVAKAGWTIRKGIAGADEILLLAFNRSAAAELAARCSARLGSVGISAKGLEARTFHAFGLRVIGEATGEKPRLAPGLDSDNGLGVLAEIVRALRHRAPAFAAGWSMFQNILGIPIDDQTDPIPDAWDAENRRSGYRALNLDVLKSSGERAIANWLIMCGVEFEYERAYEVNVADAQHSQYHPDFFYPTSKIYHEHWAFVSGDKVPRSFAGYLESSAWKKRVHASYGTTLIETAARNLSDGTLFERLERELRANGIDPEFDPDRPVPGTPLLTDREMLNLFRTFLSHAKSNRLSNSDLRARVRRGRGGAPDLRESKFLDLFDEVRTEWDRRLRESKEVDFEDMLNHATDLVESGRWESPFRVVLVDEFQDASHARARLVHALVAGAGRHLFAVGDDWQSIYRFAGSDISAMTQFEATFGAGHVLRLERTFRSPQELSTIAGDFVMKNPGQLRKQVRSERSVPAPLHLEIVGSDSEVTAAISKRLEGISALLAPGTSATVKVLGRYRSESGLMPRTRFPGVEADFQTVHSSKGLEADHVIIPGLNRGGFPSVKEDDPLLRLALPDGDSYPHAEERRLFYVAITRARESVLLIARRGRESEFVAELIDAGVVVSADGQSRLKSEVCPSCGKGLMVERQGKFGPFLACNRFPACATTQAIQP